MKRANDGGDLVLSSGEGQLGEYLGLHTGFHGSIKFFTPGVEHLRIEPDGKFYVQGRLTAEDPEIYRAFVRWLADATAKYGPDAYVVKGE